MRRFPFALPILAALVGLPAHSEEAGQAASSTRAKIDVSRLGPQVGERVPSFSLADQSGKTITLESILGPKGAMLVCIRSADW